MDHNDVPPGYEPVRQGNALGNIIHYSTRAEVDGKAVQAVHGPAGVSLRVDECNFRAIVEFLPHARLSTGLHAPDRWTVGFVQNMTAGSGITFVYGSPVPALVATFGPQTLPCKDSGSVATWYDPNPALSLKRFGTDSREFDDFPDAFPDPHRARTDELVKYVQMGDAPGTGGLPVRVPCRTADPAGLAVVGQDYTLGLTNPLGGGQPLVRIDGNLIFKTWLVLSSEPNPARLKTTDLFLYLHCWEWTVNYRTTVNMGIPHAMGVASLISDTQCDPVQTPVLRNPDANESACVRFG